MSLAVTNPCTFPILTTASCLRATPPYPFLVRASLSPAIRVQCNAPYTSRGWGPSTGLWYAVINALNGPNSGTLVCPDVSCDGGWTEKGTNGSCSQWVYLSPGCILSNWPCGPPTATD